YARLIDSRMSSLADHLIAKNRDVLGRLEAEPNLIAIHGHDRDADVIADNDLFPHFAAQDKHVYPPCVEKSWLRCPVESAALYLNRRTESRGVGPPPAYAGGSLLLHHQRLLQSGRSVERLDERAVGDIPDADLAVPGP